MRTPESTDSPSLLVRMAGRPTESEKENSTTLGFVSMVLPNAMFLPRIQRQRRRLEKMEQNVHPGAVETSEERWQMGISCLRIWPEQTKLGIRVIFQRYRPADLVYGDVLTDDGGLLPLSADIQSRAPQGCVRRAQRRKRRPRFET